MVFYTSIPAPRKPACSPEAVVLDWVERQPDRARYADLVVTHRAAFGAEPHRHRLGLAILREAVRADGTDVMAILCGMADPGRLVALMESREAWSPRRLAEAQLQASCCIAEDAVRAAVERDEAWESGRL